MIFQLFEVIIYKDQDDIYESRNYLGLWEREGQKLRHIARDRDYDIKEEDDIITTLNKLDQHKHLFENLGENESVRLEITQTNQTRGIYHPRIFRPICTDSDLEFYLHPRKQKEEDKLFNDLYPMNTQLIRSLEQLSTLVDMSNQIFKTVYPSPKNYETFGFDIRNLTILACTEFETQVTGILKENGINPKKGNYTMEDYVQLNSIMKLSAYEVRFSYYPDLPPISPFLNWDHQKATKSLEWYNNYNKIKHDRDNEFEKSRLIDAITSLSACYIILLAQYGEQQTINDLLKKHWKVEKRPIWNTEDKYVKPHKNSNWSEKKYYD